MSPEVQNSGINNLMNKDWCPPKINTKVVYLWNKATLLLALVDALEAVW